MKKINLLNTLIKIKMTCKWFDSCPLRDWEKEGKISQEWKEKYCKTKENWKNCKRFQMEEKGIPHGNILPDGSKLKDTKRKNKE